MNGNDLDFGIYSYMCLLPFVFNAPLVVSHIPFLRHKQKSVLSHTLLLINKFILNSLLAPKFASLETTFSMHMPVVHHIFISV